MSNRGYFLSVPKARGQEVWKRIAGGLSATCRDKQNMQFSQFVLSLAR